MTVGWDSQTAMSRREFLYYLWGASAALLLAESAGALVWFLLPRFEEGEFGGLFTVPLEQVPAPGAPPAEFPAGRFWLVNVAQEEVDDPRRPPGYQTRPGLLALYKVCVHLGCLYRWQPSLDLFMCPCHISKYLKDGTRVRRPAARDLDRLVVRVVDAEGEVLAETVVGSVEAGAGQPIEIPAGAAAVEVDTGKRIRGRENNGPNRVS